LLEQLQEAAATRVVPVIITSTDRRLLDRAQADTARYGEHRVFVKPFDIDELLALIHTARPWIRRTARNVAVQSSRSAAVVAAARSAPSARSVSRTAPSRWRSAGSCPETSGSSLWQSEKWSAIGHDAHTTCLLHAYRLASLGPVARAAR
jgi:hypothetical protein